MKIECKADKLVLRVFHGQRDNQNCMQYKLKFNHGNLMFFYAHLWSQTEGPWGRTEAYEVRVWKRVIDMLLSETLIQKMWIRFIHNHSI